MSDEKQRPHCYLDHANKKSENFAANPYSFWLKQVRRNRSTSEPDDRTTDTDRRDSEPGS